MCHATLKHHDLTRNLSVTAMVAVPVAMLAALVVSCSKNGAGRNLSLLDDSTRLVQLAIESVYVVTPTASRLPLEVLSFSKDSLGVRIVLSPVPPPGGLVAGGGGVVHIARDGRVTVVEVGH